jgi:hypothetical protein
VVRLGADQHGFFGNDQGLPIITEWMMADDERVPECRVPESPLAPFSLFLYGVDPPEFVLELAEKEVEAVADVFAAADIDGHAGSWEVVATLVAQSEAPDIAALLKSDRLTFQSWVGDDHGAWNDYFAVTADEVDVGALRRLGLLLAGVYREPERLGELIRNADPELFEA